MQCVPQSKHHVLGHTADAEIKTHLLWRFKGLSLQQETLTPTHLLLWRPPAHTKEVGVGDDSTISVLRYWFEFCKLPSTRFPKQALIMLRDSLITNTKNNSNWWKIVWNHMVSRMFAQMAELTMKLTARGRESLTRRSPKVQRIFAFTKLAAKPKRKTLLSQTLVSLIE